MHTVALPPPSPVLRCDLFCIVIDNFGDAGVCWRLARQLASEHGWQVRLFIDQPAVLAALQGPLTEAAARIEVSTWEIASAPDIRCADVVIEAFGCHLPAAYIAAMAPPQSDVSSGKTCVWINLEYMSAEDWVRDCHLGRSRQASGPAGLPDKTFFFPGMHAGTGGLIRERDLDERRRRWQADPAAQAAFWQTLALPAPPPDALLITLFAYENAALGSLFDQWAEAGGLATPGAVQPVVVVVPQGRISAGVAAWAGRADFLPGARLQRGALHVLAMPFVDQDRYDALLWLADLNFVRGEDSFVRAQWAARPSVWQIYQQEDDAHFDKLDAALAAMTAGMATRYPDSVHALHRFWHAWNGRGTPDWRDFWQHRDVLRNACEEWQMQLRSYGDLAGNLAEFAKNQLK